MRRIELCLSVVRRLYRSIERAPAGSLRCFRSLASVSLGLSLSTYVDGDIAAPWPRGLFRLLAPGSHSRRESGLATCRRLRSFVRSFVNTYLVVSRAGPRHGESPVASVPQSVGRSVSQ